MTIRRFDMTTWAWLMAVAATASCGSRILAQEPAKAPAASTPSRGDIDPRLGPGHPIREAAERRDAAMREVEEELRQGLATAEAQLQDVREKLRALSDGRPAEGLADTAAALHRDATRLRIDLAGLEARKDVLADAIAESRKTAAGHAERDPVATQLKELVALLEESVKRTESLHKSRDISPAEVDRARMELAGARVKLLERQQSVVQQAGGGDVSKLAEQLIGVSATLSETRARLAETEQVLKAYPKAQEVLDREQEVRWRINKLRGMIEHVEKVKLDRRLGVPSAAEAKN